MIDQSEYWKDLLLENAKRLKLLGNRKRWTDSTFAELEKLVFLSFYGFRKLAESQKLSNSTIDTDIKLSTYPPLGKLVTRMNWYKIDELYDFESKNTTNINARQLCNQFIHSYVFSPYFDFKSEKLMGLLFSSDRDRNRLLYSIRLRQIINLLNKAGHDYPNFVSIKYDSKILDYRYFGEMRTDKIIKTK